MSKRSDQILVGCTVTGLFGGSSIGLATTVVNNSSWELAATIILGVVALVGVLLLFRAVSRSDEESFAPFAKINLDTKELVFPHQPGKDIKSYANTIPLPDGGWRFETGTAHGQDIPIGTTDGQPTEEDD